MEDIDTPSAMSFVPHLLYRTLQLRHFFFLVRELVLTVVRNRNPKWK